MSIPAIPAGFVPIPLGEFRGFHPTATKIAALPDVIAELTGSTTYDAKFGSFAPPLDPFVQALSDASGWTGIRIALDTYILFAKAQEGLAWKALTPQVDKLKTLYDLAVAENAQVAAQFPAVTRLVGLASQVTQKGLATRKRAKATAAATAATAAKAASTAATTAGTAPAASATPTVTAPAATPATGGAGH